MVDPDRLPLAGLVEVNESSLPQRRRDDPRGGGQGRSGRGKMPIGAAVEVDGRRRLRVATIAGHSTKSLHAFIARAVAPDATIRTDAWNACPGAPAAGHEPHAVGPVAAHLALPPPPPAGGAPCGNRINGLLTIGGPTGCSAT